MMMRKLYRRLSLTAAMLFMFASVLLAQERTVSGTITDETGGSMPGVNVLVKGTSTGTASDADGNFKISVQSDASVLLFTFVGYATAEVVVGSRSVVNVQLTPDVRMLTELVVTGYSTQRKQDITGAVSVVKVDELQNVQASSISQKLEGRAAGVMMSTSGEPGEGTNIRIRGLSSFQRESNPLWIIDGVASTDKGNNWLNPNDIESIQVLKDASTASIYGSRANNGVVIVTTKKGKAGKTKVQYSGYVGTQSAVKGYNSIISTKPLENAEAFHQYFANSSATDAIPNDNYYYQYELDGTLPEYTWPISNLATDGSGDLISPSTGNVVFNINDYKYSSTNSGTDDDFLVMGSNPKGTDWWDELFNPATITEHNLSVSGGTDNSQFNFGAGYFKQEGTMIHTNFDRFTARANSSFKVGNKVTLGENIAFARTFRTTQVGSNQDNQNSLTNTLLMHPIIPLKDIGGNWAGAKAISNGSNPVAAQYRNKDNGTTSYKVFGNVFGEAELTPWLKYRTSFGIDFAEWVYTGFNFATPENREPTLNNGFQENWNHSFNWQWTNTIEVNKKIDKHQINFLAGYEAIKNTYRGINGRINSYFTENPNAWYLNAGTGDAGTRTVSSQGSPSTLVSMFGKLDYTYNDKYILSATIRRDGSSNFGVNNRYGVFPAASLGWRMSAEQFMSSLTWISDLKWRFGYGVTGNQAIDPGNGYDQYGGAPGTTFYDINGSNTGSVTGYAQTRFGNPNGKWEENVSMNAGLDLSLLDNKLQIVVDIYKREINGLLATPQYPGTQGSAAPPFVNIGDMENKGIDLSVSYRGNITNDLGFNVSLNATHYKNKVLFVSDDIDFFYSGGADGHAQYVINKVGYPMASFYGYNYLGPIKSDAEGASLPTQLGGNGNVGGGWNFQDRDGDGAVDPDDRTIIGNPHPDLTLGINLALNYKAFDFSMFLYASIGNDIYNYQKYYYETGRWGSVFSKEMLTDAWTPENPNARLPQLNVDFINSADVASSYYIEDGSYLRAKTIQFGYTVPTTILSKIGASNARVYVQGQNLFTITGYSGIDPVLSNVDIGDGNANDQYMGTDLGNYPSSRIFSVGLTLGF